MSRGSVCFTGAGTRLSGEKYTRPMWQNLARQFNFDVHDKVDWGTTYLVASRTDTTKAASARTLGTHVITYADFERMVLAGQTPQAQPRSTSQFFDPPPEITWFVEEERSDGWHRCNGRLHDVFRSEAQALENAKMRSTKNGRQKFRVTKNHGTLETVVWESRLAAVTNAVDAERTARAIQWED